MGKALVDVRHPDVGIGRVPERTLHLYERHGWKPISREEATQFAGELGQLDRAFGAAGVTAPKDRRALSALSKEERAELQKLAAAEETADEPGGDEPTAPAEVPSAPAESSTPSASTRPTTSRSGGTSKEG